VLLHPGYPHLSPSHLSHFLSLHRHWGTQKKSEDRPGLFSGHDTESHGRQQSVVWEQHHPFLLGCKLCEMFAVQLPWDLSIRVQSSGQGTPLRMSFRPERDRLDWTGMRGSCWHISSRTAGWT
jgi:hypothetical protein